MSDQARARENEAYLAAHPEVKELMSAFLVEVLRVKPANVRLFAQTYFSKAPSSPMDAMMSMLQPMIPASLGNNMPAPLIIVGPSGVGKGTLINRLMKEFDSHFGFSVSHTTRKPRDGELHGVHYHFSTHEDMRNGMSCGLFIEYAEVHGNIYGTSFDSVGNVQMSGKICVLDIDVQGMEAVKKTHLNPRTVFIKPPSHAELEKRLRNRGTETDETLQRRLKNAHAEIEHLEKPGTVHHTVVNDNLDRAYDQLKSTLIEWYPHLKTIKND